MLYEWNWATLKIISINIKCNNNYRSLHKVNEVDSIINTPNRWKAQCLCHVNMIKPYVDRAESVEHPATRTVPVLVVEKGSVVVPPVCEVASDNMKLKTSDELGNKVMPSVLLTATTTFCID